ncbi:MAG: ferrous iron transporter B, partial [Clostridiales bacterium]
MSITIALAGNPNSGKTTLFNELTGANQFVGNWPGVTVEKKEGKYKDAQDVVIIDLPGIYSLSPYTPEEVVARNYLHSRQADVILNIVDGTNLERNLYLTTQLTELGIPVVAAINMMDIVAGNGDEINLLQLSKALGCAVVELSALKGTGITAAVEGAIVAAKQQIPPVSPHGFCGSVEHTLAHIEEATLHEFPEDEQRWYAIKLFERDQQVIRQLQLDQSTLAHIESDIKKCEAELDDDAESIIINERYTYISSIINGCYLRKNKERNSISDKIDRVVTNRWAALPIFALVMFVVYFVSVTTVGAWASHWVADGVFGEGWHLLGIGSGAYQGAVAALQDVGATIPVNPADYGIWVPGVSVVLGNWLQVINCAEWLQGLILDGIVGGVGAVLGFVPQMLVLFLFLAFLEACGYMVRIAFIMDRIFRKFGLSGKSFIPMLIGTGCGVPGIMASRTIEN